MTTTTTVTHAPVQTSELNWTVSCQQQRKCEAVNSVDFFVDKSPIKWRVKLEYLKDEEEYYEPEQCGEIFITWRLKLEAAILRNTNNADSNCTVAGETTVQVVYSFDEMSEFKCDFVKRRNEIKTYYSEVCVYGVFTCFPDSDLQLTCTVNSFKMNDVIPLIISTNRNLSAGFEHLYLNEKHSDVTLQINDNRYPAHKVILGGSSKVFATMFEHDMKENDQNLVEMKGIDEQVFLQALRYMYSGKVTDADTLVYDLLPVADQYDIVGLKELCESVLNKHLSLETVVKTLVLADSCNAKILKNLAIKFILKRSKDVARRMSAEDWHELLSRPTLSKDVMILLMENLKK